jgi:hypothetical protein
VNFNVVVKSWCFDPHAIFGFLFLFFSFLVLTLDLTRFGGQFLTSLSVL